MVIPPLLIAYTFCNNIYTKSLAIQNTLNIVFQESETIQSNEQSLGPQRSEGLITVSNLTEKEHRRTVAPSIGCSFSSVVGV